MGVFLLGENMERIDRVTEFPTDQIKIEFSVAGKTLRINKNMGVAELLGEIRESQMISPLNYAFSKYGKEVLSLENLLRRASETFSRHQEEEKRIFIIDSIFRVIGLFNKAEKMAKEQKSRRNVIFTSQSGVPIEISADMQIDELEASFDMAGVDIRELNSVLTTTSVEGKRLTLLGLMMSIQSMYKVGTTTEGIDEYTRKWTMIGVMTAISHFNRLQNEQKKPDGGNITYFKF